MYSKDIDKRESVLLCRKRWYYKHREKILLKKKILYNNNRETLLQRTRISNKNRRVFIRSSLMDLLGNVCVHCGFSDRRALQFDHINGGGCKDMKNGHLTMLRKYYKDPELAKNTLQLLCANCNYIKEHEKYDHIDVY